MEREADERVSVRLHQHSETVKKNKKKTGQAHNNVWKEQQRETP